MEKIYTPNDVAERYSVKIKTVWEWIKAGKLPAMKLGKFYRISESDLTAFEQANMKKV